MKPQKKHFSLLFGAAFSSGAALLLLSASASKAQKPETVGGGTVAAPAVGPPPSYGLGGPGMVLVKNWHFGTGGTIKNYADMNANFLYHDQFGTIGNGTNYGAVIVAPDAADALPGQPVEGVNSPPVRKFTADSMITLLTPLNGATTVDPNKHNAGNGSFVAKWKLPHGGSLLGRDFVWETRVRYVTPPYFWFAIWNAGNKWAWNNGAAGAEQDLVESFGYDNGGGNTNYDGRFWHSDSVSQPSRDTVGYADWGRAMGQQGITSYDASQYHVWTLQYNKDNSYACYVDGVLVQRGSDFHWTYGSKPGDEPIDMDFIFDAGWGHTQVGSVNHPLPASAFDGKFYEWSYSRVYLSAHNAPRSAAFHGPHPLPGTVKAADYDAGGQTVSYYYRPGAARSAYRPHDAVALEACTDTGGGFDLTGAAPSQYVKYTVRAAKAGTYVTAFRVAATQPGGAFHLEDEHGNNLSGPIAAPSTAAPAAWSTVSATVTVPAGLQTLTLVQDAPGIKLNWFRFGVTVTPGLLPDGNYKLLSGSSGQALDVGGQHTDNGSGLDLYEDNSQANQAWTLHHLGNGVYEIIGVQSGRSLTVGNGSATISDYGDRPEQKWIISGAPGAYKIKSAAGGNLFGTDAAGALSLAPDAGLPGQVWKIVPLP